MGTHRIAALYQELHKAGAGADECIGAATRLKLLGLTASHIMEGFPGSERNCNPWMVSTACCGTGGHMNQIGPHCAFADLLGDSSGE